VGFEPGEHIDRFVDEAPDESPALAFPLRTQKGPVEGLFWAVTLVSLVMAVNARFPTTCG